MRTIRSVLLVGVLLHASPVIAADALRFGPAPAWVASQTIPAAPDSAKDRPVALLLHDQQAMLRPGSITTFTELAFKIQKPEGLAAGNLSIAWNPATDTATVNRLEIHRGDEVIDVLKSGQTFTTLRRESNLESAMLDGVLTANIQPEGLREGDVVVLATTNEHVDPVLKGHVETMFAPWGEAQIGLAHARLSWPAGVELKITKAGDLPPPQQATRDGVKSFELVMRNTEPVIPPKDAPVRFKIGRFGEATDFRSWADVAKLMMPLYSTAATVPPSGPLREELEKIRKASTDPKVRAEQALTLVQERVRYVALLMGEGGYVPANADTTWSRRFGDCKAKTVLLLALLHELGISAEPVMANIGIGDAVADRLPMIGIFNHVFVRAHVAGKDYWLDGTRTGDTTLEAIDTPDYGWVLPLTENAQLVHLVPGALAAPSFERHVDIDASDGVFAPASITISETYHKDSAVEYNAAYSQLSGDQRSELMRNEAKGFFDSFDMTSSSVIFDAQQRQLSIIIKGKSKLNWDNSWFFVPTSSIAFNPDFDRSAGAFHDAPIKVSHPRFVRDIATVKLPAGFAQQQKLHAAVHETLAGVEYARSESVAGDTLTVESSERSVAEEIPYKEADAAAPRLRALDKEDVYLRLADNYQPSEKDWPGIGQMELSSAQQYIDRGLIYLTGHKYDEAIADFTRASELDPKNAWAVANRAIAYGWKHDFITARKDIAAATALDANNPVAARAEGLVDEQAGNYSDAIKAFSKSLVSDPTNTFALVHRAFLYAASWKYDAALADVSAILQRDPKNVGALATRSLIHANKGDLAAAKLDLAAATAIDAANDELQYAVANIAELSRDSNSEIAAYSKLLQSTGNKAPVYAERAATYFRLNRYDDALADSEQALKLGQHDAPLRVVRANVFMIRGDRSAVAAEAEAMMRENPGSEYALVAAAKTYSALGMRPKAMEAFDRALAIQPEVIVYINRSQVRPITDIEGRIADLDAALKLEPDNVDALSIKAHQLVLKGDYPTAIQIYDRAATLDPNPENTSIPFGRALALYRSGHQQQARDLLANERHRAKSASDYQDLCWAEVSGNMFIESALADCQQALKLDPKTRHDNIALELLRLNRLDEASAEFTHVINQSHSAYGYFGRSITYSRQGKLTDAAADRAEALKLNPDEESAFAEYGLKL